MSNAPRYEIEDWHILDGQSGSKSKKLYIREILDWGSSECQHSSLSILQRYEIISELGLDALTAVLKDCFARNNKPYDAEQVAAITYILYCKELGLKCNNLPESMSAWLEKSEQLSLLQSTPILLRAMENRLE